MTKLINPLACAFGSALIFTWHLKFSCVKTKCPCVKRAARPAGDRSVAHQRPRVRASEAAARLLVHQSNPALARAYAFRPRSFSRPAPSCLHASLHPAADQAEQCCCWHQCPRRSCAAQRSRPDDRRRRLSAGGAPSVRPARPASASSSQGSRPTSSSPPDL